MRVRLPPEVLESRLVVGEMATPPASGAGDRRFDSCRPDDSKRGAGSARRQPPRPEREARWRSGFPREPHELETWVRIPPAQFSRGRSSTEERSFVRREGAGSIPVVPASWWPWCSGSTRGCEPRGAGSTPAGHPLADAEHRRAQRAVTPPRRAVVVRLHPSALLASRPRRETIETEAA
jgi:hypothetical protein